MNFRIFKSAIQLDNYNEIDANDLITFIRTKLSHSPIFVFADDYLVPMNIIGFAYFNFAGAFENHWENVSLVIKNTSDRKKFLEFLRPYLKENN